MRCNPWWWTIWLVWREKTKKYDRISRAQSSTYSIWLNILFYFFFLFSFCFHRKCFIERNKERKNVLLYIHTREFVYKFIWEIIWWCWSLLLLLIQTIPILHMPNMVTKELIYCYFLFHSFFTIFFSHPSFFPFRSFVRVIFKMLNC